MTKVIFILMFLFSTSVCAQKSLEISLEGYINNFSSKEKIYGASMYMFQNGGMVSKSLSDSKGFYFISGSIKTKLPFELMVSKPGYITKKVLLDFQELKIQNANGILQAMEELVIELFEVRDGADLAFTKDTYAEKFTWDPSRNIAVPEVKYKKDIEDEVIKAYALAAEGSSAERFKKLLASSLKNNIYADAVKQIDSILVYEPDNSALKSKKEELELLLEKIQKDREERSKFEEFKKKGDLAFAKSNLDVAEENYKSALDIIDDNQVKYRLGKIEESRAKDRMQLENNKELITLRNSADSLRNEKAFIESVAKLKLIQVMDPGQRSKIQSEIKEIRKESEDYRFSSSIEKYIERAQAQYERDSLDAGLANYRKAETLIKKLSNQRIINTYAQQVENGIAEISGKKSSEESGFRKQIEKAYSNVLKGPEFYELATRILDSEPMKARAKDQKVIALKKQIKSLEEMYAMKQQAMNKLSSDKQGALLEMKKAYKIANANYRIIPEDDLKQMKDSLSSWAGGADFISSKNPPSQVNSNGGSLVNTPGELHNGSDFEAFNDLSATIRKRKSEPLKDLQDVRNEIDYELFFDKTNENVRNEASSKEMQTFMNTVEINQKEVNSLNVDLQQDQQSSQQDFDAAVQFKAYKTREKQEVSALQIEEWKTEKEYLLSMDRLNQIERGESFSERQNILDNERVMINRQNDIDNEERLYNSQKQILQLGFEVQQRDSLAKVSGEDRVRVLESLKSTKTTYATQPNFLKDENGILFPSNKMTQRVFKRTNAQGDVTSVTIQRVVVDPNGYGVVYEQTTNQSGTAFYTRNNASVSEHVWFNESSGADVVQE
jgi:hypothetical protein